MSITHLHATDVVLKLLRNQCAPVCRAAFFSWLALLKQAPLTQCCTHAVGLVNLGVVIEMNERTIPRTCQITRYCSASLYLSQIENGILFEVVEYEMTPLDFNT